MSRTYTLKRRAEKQAETRRRFVEAAVELHSSIGPALTTLSMVAERARVQRHTLYAHFPDERSLLLACSGLTAERDRCRTQSPGGRSRTSANACAPACVRSTTGTGATRSARRACCATPNTTR